MQDDLAMIQHLVGWACVSYGLQGLNQVARQQDDGAMVAATTLALGDYNAMRQIAAQWTTSMSLASAFHKRPWGWSVSFDDAALDRVIAAARETPLRCMRAEALYQLVIMGNEGTRTQRSKAAAALAEVGRDPDQKLADLARWLDKEPYDRTYYRSGLE